MHRRTRVVLGNSNRRALHSEHNHDDLPPILYRSDTLSPKAEVLRLEDDISNNNTEERSATLRQRLHRWKERDRSLSLSFDRLPTESFRGASQSLSLSQSSVLSAPPLSLRTLTASQMSLQATVPKRFERTQRPFTTPPPPIQSSDHSEFSALERRTRFGASKRYQPDTNHISQSIQGSAAFITDKERFSRTLTADECMRSDRIRRQRKEAYRIQRRRTAEQRIADVYAEEHRHEMEMAEKRVLSKVQQRLRYHEALASMDKFRMRVLSRQSGGSGT